MNKIKKTLDDIAEGFHRDPTRTAAYVLANYDKFNMLAKKQVIGTFPGVGGSCHTFILDKKSGKVTYEIASAEDILDAYMVNNFGEEILTSGRIPKRSFIIEHMKKNKALSEKEQIVLDWYGLKAVIEGENF